MIDSEVERLRRLRSTALRVRAVARALNRVRALKYAPSSLQYPLLERGGCAAWRVARAVSGRLRAHPYERFQKDAGAGVVLKNSIVATAAVLGARNRQQAIASFAGQLKQLARELDHARALTWSADLSDSFGRSQSEIRSLLAELEYMACAHATRAPVAPIPIAPRGVNAPGYATTAEVDWPYLAL